MKAVKYKKALSAALCAFMLCASPTAVLADRLPWYDQQSTVTGTGGAAATEHPLASAAAMRILQAGGNAVEAAIAASAVQGVVRPFSGGIGGGGYMHIYLKDTNQFIVLDHRDVAASSFGPSSFLDENGNEFADVIRDSSGVAVGVPGMVKAWEEALQLYGSGQLTLSDVLQPAIEAAEDGFYADHNFIREITENAERFRAFTSTTDIYLNPDGSVPAPGTLMKNPDLADTYRLIAQHGSSVFYQGEIGQALVQTVNHPPVSSSPSFQVLPGSMSMSDVQNYQTLTYSPLHVNYRGYDIYGLPPSSSAGATIGEALNILEGYPLASMPRSTALHYYLEASRRAFADRNAYLGDPNTFSGPMPISGMLSKNYAEQVRQEITERGTQRIVDAGNPWPFDANPQLQAQPLPSRGKQIFAADFAGTANGSPWDDTGKFATGFGIGSGSPGIGVTMSVYNEAGRIELPGAQYGYARASSVSAPVYDSEVLLRFKLDELGGNRNLRVWLRADDWNSTSAPHNGYGVEINTASDTIRMIRTRDSNGVYGLSTASHARTTDWQWLRFRVEGDQLRVRIWKDGEQEPRDSWTQSLQSQSVNSKGTFMLSAVELTGAAEGGGIQVDDIRVTELNPASLTADFSQAANGASWDSTNLFTTNVGIGSSNPGTGGVIDIQDGIGRMYVDKTKFAYARATSVMNAVYDSELLVKFKMDSLGADRNLRLWLRADGWNSTSAPHNGYGVEINTQSDTIRLLRTRQSNGIYGLTTIDHPRTTDWQWLRFRVEGNVLKVRLWNDGQPEPVDWLHQRTNGDVTAPGKWMASAIELTGGTGIQGGSFLIDELKVYNLDAVNTRESTIHLTVSDADGNIVAYTHTLNSIGGNAMVVPGYGFLLNNGLNTRVPSSSPEGHPNAPRPGMRSLSSMSPTIVLQNGEPVLALGSPGGQTILTSVLQVLINRLDFGMTLPQAVAAPRLSQNNGNAYGRTLIEPEVTAMPEYEQLRQLGQPFSISGLTYGIGSVNAIAFLPDGQVQPVSEPVRRGGGSAMVESLYPPASP
ncbi:gamma-glutamyltranspeptidase [Paenibacillus sp. UNCCL117]|uniref:gamma-glutamyltransferase n=1 Tax=unclassified Paenibacillus TaxID=185978 RepID=UPI0008895EB2|nr:MULTISPECIES: gamma-glutamyltransferase [unclassified Paenibacillus]SDD79590.1 gamma-glutamyltranspeptidase [Paenibacillus sp. cl123]SFW53236.1 gamma-glutamyltranspeptidase [Paenibacillus sp. UNCCL117]